MTTWKKVLRCWSEALAAAAQTNDDEAARAALKQAVPTYKETKNSLT